jgi:hypothetical protein
MVADEDGLSCLADDPSRRPPAARSCPRIAGGIQARRVDRSDPPGGHRIGGWSRGRLRGGWAAAATTDGDAIGPLSAVRDDLGNRPKRYAFGYTAGVLVMVTLMGLVASATITLASGLIR